MHKYWFFNWRRHIKSEQNGQGHWFDFYCPINFTHQLWSSTLTLEIELESVKIFFLLKFGEWSKSVNGSVQIDHQSFIKKKRDKTAKSTKEVDEYHFKVSTKCALFTHTHGLEDLILYFKQMTPSWLSP